MKSINFTHTGGMPFSQDVAGFMQAGYSEPLGALAGLIGEKTILQGVVVSGGNVSAGWITWNGMIIPFEAGLATDRVDIIVTTSNLMYEDGQEKQVFTIRVARCVNVGGFPFSDLRRLSTYRNLMDMVVPQGMISMWSGTVPPAGWALCDGGGSPARPDLRGRFIVGYDPGDADYDAIGKAGGSKRHTLTALEMPSHTHGFAAFNPENSVGGSGDGNHWKIGAGPTPIQPTGGNQPHENRPPYYTLAYIIKL